MKKLSAILLMILSIRAMGQTQLFGKDFKVYAKKEIPSLSLAFVAGVADGVNQTIQFHYQDFKRIFPNARDEFWNPQISWVNKYKYNDPTKGEKFYGSKSGLVFTTDGYHMTRFVEHITAVGSLTIKIGFGHKQKWYAYVIQGLTYWAVNRSGMAITYNAFLIK